MVFEYEFRLAVCDVAAPDLRRMFDTITTSKDCYQYYRVWYGKRNFRYRHGKLETKSIRSQVAVCCSDNTWFRFVESEETPFEQWSRATHVEWMRLSTHFQDPFSWEDRIQLELGRQAKIYAFRKASESTFGVVFECEWGHAHRRQTFHNLEDVANRLLPEYRNVYSLLKGYPPPKYTLTVVNRKPVVVVDTLPKNPPFPLPKKENTVVIQQPQQQRQLYLYAHKHDGTFCVVYSYDDHLVIRREDNRYKVIRGTSLGDGLVFAGETLRDGTIVLLDVYQVQGVQTAPCRHHVLMHFLPSLQLPDGFVVQRYAYRLRDLTQPPPEATDGFVCHDVVKDEIYKLKFEHTLDAVYWNGWFELADGSKIQHKDDVTDDQNSERKRKMKNGRIYEISLTGRILRTRRDRFVGNSEKQLKRIYRAKKK